MADRLRDGVLLAASLLSMALAASPVSRMLALSWQTEGSVVRPVVTGLLSAVGVSLAQAIALSTGLIAGLALLFVLDSSKLIQGAIFVLTLPIFYGTLRNYDLWTIPWAPNAVPAVVGVVVGLAVGQYRSRVDSTSDDLVPRVREFPGAASAIYALLTVAVVIGFVQAHLVTSAGESILVDGVASATLVVMTAVFTTYCDDRSVLIVSPDRYEEANILGGVYREARAEFGAEKITDPKRVREEDLRAFDRGLGLNAAAVDEVADVPTRYTVASEAKDNLLSIHGTVGFRFKPPGVFSRTLEVTTRGFSPNSIDVGGLKASSGETGVVPVIRRYALDAGGYAFRALVPSRVRAFLFGSSSNAQRSLREADVVLLVGKLDTLRSGSGEVAEGATHGSSVLWTYDQICKADAMDGKTVRLVPTDAHEAKDRFEEERAMPIEETAPTEYTQTFGRYLRQNELGNTCCEVIPVFRLLNDEQDSDIETRLWGADEILDDLY